MGNILIRLFVKNYQNTKDPTVRESYGKLAGLVGICTNLLLSVSKLVVGLIINSIAIIADGINNLADMSSSVITLFGFRLAAKPEDKEHPYGHARIEYLTGTIVSVIIMLIGFKLLTSSFDKILHPTPLEFNYITLIILVLAIGVKVWQAMFYIKLGNLIHSATLKATGSDSRNDVIATSAVLLSMIIGKLTGLQLDGYIGCLVALFIVYSGIQLVKETSSPLLGKAPDHELVEEIQTRICSQPEVFGIHDLVIHDYGPGRIFASVHVEVDAHGDLIKSHDMIDNIERSISQDLNIHLVIHMDPLETKDPLTIELNHKINDILTDVDGVIGFHDLRLVAGYSHSNVIFDIVLAPDSDVKEVDIRKLVEEKLKEYDKQYYVVITFDKSYLNNNI